MLAEGRTMKEIAFRLELSPRTIAFHKYKMMTKTNNSMALLIGLRFRIYGSGVC